VTREQVKESIESWLRHANDRLKLKAKKLGSQEVDQITSSCDEHE
ncbi:unnamed protein product, partial [Allacma fusca]